MEKITAPAPQGNDEIMALQEQVANMQKELKAIEDAVGRRPGAVTRQTVDILDEQDAMQLKIEELHKASTKTPNISSTSQD